MRNLLSSVILSLVFTISSISLSAQLSVFSRIQSHPDLQKFEEAIISAGLVSTFSSNQGVFTIFAPSNAFFNTVPASILNNPTALKDLILTHCVAGYYRSPDFVNGFAVSTINNRNLTVQKNANGIIINGGKLTTLDLTGGNGVVHIIDRVLYPSNTTLTTVMSIIDNSPTHTVFGTIIRNANLESRFTGTNKVTVFAPTNEALFALSTERFNQLVGTNVNFIENVVMFHVINAVIEHGDFKNGGKLNAANGQQLSVTVNINGTYVNNVKVGFAGLRASNGIVYVINKVLWPQPKPAFTIADYIEQSDDHSTLENLVNASGLRGTLAGAGPLTFFAPTNAAFNLLDDDFLDALVNDPQGELRNVLRNHLVNGKKYSEELIDDELTLAVNGFELIVDRTNNVVFVNDARITVFNVEADNGLVHVINAVLVEPEPFTVRDILSTNEGVTNFYNYTVKSGLDVQLDGDGPFTVFAPTDAAMSLLPAALKEELDGQLLFPLIEFIENHIVTPSLTTSQMTNGLNLTAQNGFIIEVRFEGINKIFINEAELIIRNLVADNGVVHIIDKALYTEEKPSTIYEYVAINENHTILETAIQKAQLQFLYESPGPLTLFAPTNDAFNKLPDAVLDELFTGSSTALVDVLLGHTLNDDYNFNELIVAGTVENANAEDLTISVLNNEVYVNNAKIEISNITLDNGIIHVIDAIIVPPTVKNTVLDVVANSNLHNTLESAINNAGLADLYDLQSPITLFAPTDAAFNRLPSALLNSILADPNGLLRELLLYHTHEELLLTQDMVDGMIIEMLDNSDVLITINSEGIFINEARITVENIEADNGVVHVLDAVVQPIIPRNTIYDVIVNDDNYSMLEDAVNAAGLADELINGTTITLFAPTNIAFNALPPQVLDDLFADPQGALRDLLLYHLFDHLLPTSSITNGIEIVMENGDVAPLTIVNGDYYINEARFIQPDIQADNGLVHGLNAISMPAEVTLTVYDIISNEEEVDIFKAMVDASNMAEDLIEADLISLFVPTNEAFEALEPGVVDALFADPSGALRDFLLKHQRNGLLLTSFMTDGLVLTMANGDDVTVSVTSNGIYINESRIIIRDILADNGVVHVLEAVITEPAVRNTVYNVVVNSLSLNTLESLVNQAGLAQDLTEMDGITLFAPTDQAFELLPDGLLDDLMADPNGLLRDVLRFHILDEELKFLNLIFKTSLTMSNGENVFVTRVNNEIFINDAKIVGKDIQAENGIVHLVDAVVQPKTSSTLDLGKDYLLTYPNPVVDQLFVNSYDISNGQDVRYQLLDLQGKLIMTGVINQKNNSIDVTQLHQGKYILRLSNQNEAIQSFIKMN